MQLTMETISVTDLQFGEKTELRGGVMYVSREDILAFGREEPIFNTLKIDITYPGDSVRIINVCDVVQPGCKVSGSAEQHLLAP